MANLANPWTDADIWNDADIWLDDPPSGPVPTGYPFYKEITVDATNVDVDLSDFPLLVKLTNDPDVGAAAKPDLSDVRFYSSDGVTEYPYERQEGSVSDGNANGIFWVKVPAITAASGATVRMYYGRKDAADGSNPKLVWSDYYFVHHAESLLGETTGRHFDRAEVNGSPSIVSGKIKDAVSLNSANPDWLRFSEPDVGFNSQGDFSISAWYKTTTANPYGSPFSLNSFSNRYFGFITRSNGSGTGSAWYRDGQGGNTQLNSVVQIDDGQWHHGLLEKNGDTISFYQDGVFVDSAFTDEDFLNGERVTIGCRFDSGAPNQLWNGEVDECRIWQRPTTAAHAKFEFQNINAADNELTIGAQQSTGVTAGDKTWLPGYDERQELQISGTNVDADLADFPLLWQFSNESNIGQKARSDGHDIRFGQLDAQGIMRELPYERQAFDGWLNPWTKRKQITVSAANVDSELSDFPLLIRFDSDTDISSSARADGYDLRVTDLDGNVLPIELQEYSAGTGTIWCKVPSISAGTGAKLWLYYGNSDADSDPSDHARVWSRYSAVYHGYQAQAGSWMPGPNYRYDIPLDPSVSFGSGPLGQTVDIAPGGNQSVPPAVIWNETTRSKTRSHVEAYFLQTENEGSVNRRVMALSTVNGLSRNTGTYNNNVTGYLIDSGSSASQLFSSSTKLTFGNWEYEASMADFPGAVHRTYLNGEQVQELALINTRRMRDSNGDHRGYLCNIPTTATIRLQQIRIGDFLTADIAGPWYKFTYANLNEVDNELTYGAEEDQSSAVASGTFWIKVPRITASGDAVYVFYGRLDAADGSNPGLTFSDYGLVHHFENNQAPPGSLQFVNSSAQHPQLLDGIAMDETDIIAGKIGNGIETDGAAKYLKTEVTELLANQTQITFSFWFNAAIQSPSGAFVSWREFSNATQVEILWRSSQLRFQAWWETNDAFHTSDQITLNQWTHAVTVMDSVASTCDIYLDGASTPVSVPTYSNPTTASNQAIGIGARQNGTSLNAIKIDEVRILPGVKLTADWAKFEYHNQNSADNEITPQTPETRTLPVLEDTAVFRRGRASEPSYVDGLG